MAGSWMFTLLYGASLILSVHSLLVPVHCNASTVTLDDSTSVSCSYNVSLKKFAPASSTMYFIPANSSRSEVHVFDCNWLSFTSPPKCELGKKLSTRRFNATVDKLGRATLKISLITREDAGTYVCQVLANPLYAEPKPCSATVKVPSTKTATLGPPTSSESHATVKLATSEVTLLGSELPVDNSETESTVWIAGGVAAFVVIVVLVIVVVLFLRRRRKRNARASKSRTLPEDVENKSNSGNVNSKTTESPNASAIPADALHAASAIPASTEPNEVSNETTAMLPHDYETTSIASDYDNVPPKQNGSQELKISTEDKSLSDILAMKPLSAEKVGHVSENCGLSGKQDEVSSEISSETEELLSGIPDANSDIDCETKSRVGTLPGFNAPDEMARRRPSESGSFTDQIEAAAVGPQERNKRKIRRKGTLVDKTEKTLQTSQDKSEEF